MITEGKVANALGGKTARACDSCLKKRARWFCDADDAFLCQACDVSVHSANQLASRHERVRLETSSSKATEIKRDQNSQPTWHKGFTRKPRTPRNTKPSQVQPPNKDQISLVPEISNDQISVDETHDQEQLLFSRVPVFDSFAAELCTDEMQNMQADEGAESFTVNELLDVKLQDDYQDLDIPELNASDAELAEFAADVESLLGKGLEDDSCDKEENDVVDVSFEDKRLVKVEDDEDDQEVQAVVACHFNPSLDSATESLKWDFEYSSPVTGEEELKLTLIETPLKDIGNKEEEEERRMMLLKLNYEEVITAWANQGSAWADGTKPDAFQPHGYWPDVMDTSHRELHNLYGAGGGWTSSRNEEREARVLRYREKRRTRLFSKKIRYEVRKLNAEKRPRIKGRFVKRSSFGGPSFSYLMHKST